MDVKDYIATGILECYVMGKTTPFETLQVEAMIAKHQEIRAEIDKIENDLIALAQQTATEPSEKIKGKIYTAITGETMPEKPKKVIDINMGKTKNNTLLKWAVAASIALLLTSAGYNYYLNEKLTKANSSYIDLSEEYSILQRDYEALNTSYEYTTEELAIYENPEMKMICLMADSKDTTHALAHVYWDIENKSVFLEVNNLPLAPDTMQYQLWAIDSGIPKSAGLLTNLTLPVLRMQEVSRAQAFAISLEKKGSTAILPEGKIYVSGEI